MSSLDGRLKRLDRQMGRCLGCPVCGRRLDEEHRHMVIQTCREPRSKDEIIRRIMEILGIVPIENQGEQAERCPGCPVCGKQIGEERRKRVVKAYVKPLSPEEAQNRVDEIFGLTSIGDKEGAP